jgi:hypothetical protein
MSAPVDVDVTTVPCPDCQAPAGTVCYTSGDHTHHAARATAAEYAALTPGVCELCGRRLLAGTVGGQQLAVHPDPTDAEACPPLPDPLRDPEGWALAVNLGYQPGRPGIEHWKPEGDPDA